MRDGYYFNYLLFAPIWFARQVIRVLRLEPDSEGSINTPLIDAVLRRIFALDVATAPKLRPRFGVSILAVAARAGNA